MRIMIDIPENIINGTKNNYRFDKEDIKIIYNAIKNSMKCDDCGFKKQVFLDWFVNEFEKR